MTQRFNTATTSDTTVEWLTPKYIMDLLGEFDTDPCASASRTFDCAKVNYTKDDDGLSQEWKGRVWLNPPYGKQAAEWMKRLSEHDGSGLALIFARTDSRWFQEYVLCRAKAIFFWKGRIAFLKEGKEVNQTANAASCLVTYSMSEIPLLAQLEEKGYGKLALLKL